MTGGSFGQDSATTSSSQAAAALAAAALVEQQTIAGVFTTTYMTSGTGAPGKGGASYAVSQQCNQQNNCQGGLIDVGSYASTCASDDHMNWGEGHIVHINKKGSLCVPPNPLSFCPISIGGAVIGNWTGPNG
jgi:hypothetical protein